MTATRPDPRHFVPGDPRAVAAGKKSAEVRRRKREEREARQAEEATLVATFLDLDISTTALGDAALATATSLIKRVAAGEIEVTNGTQAAAIIGKLYDIGRLEAGQVTSLSGSVNLQLTDDQIRERMARASVVVPPEPTTPQVTTPALPPSPT